MEKRRKPYGPMKNQTKQYKAEEGRTRTEENEGARRRYEPGSIQRQKPSGEGRQGVQSSLVSEEERMRRRRALRRKREQRMRRRLAAAVAVAVLALGGAAFGILYSVSRNTQTADMEAQAKSGGTITESIQNNIEESGDGSGSKAVGEEESIALDETEESNTAVRINEIETDSAEGDRNKESEAAGEKETDSGQEPSLSEIAQLGTLNSPYAILLDASTGEVLAEQNADTQMYPASMTKILTAVTAMESVSSLDETVTMPYEIYEALYEEGASMAGFEAGEQASVRELLYGVILPSGAECCITLADLIDGSESAFVQRMNQKAQELGMNSSHFVTCTGLHDAQHYSTVRDIAVLLQYALQSSAFREIFTAHSYSVAPTTQHPEGFTFYSTMFQSLGDASVTGGEILGGKTGYTEEAGLCLASLAQVNGREYILVTAGAPGSHDTEPLHTIDAKAVYNRIGEAVTQCETEEMKK